MSERNVGEVWLRDELKKWSSQLLDNLSDYLICAPEKFVRCLWWDSNQWPLWCWCSALTNIAMKPLNGSICWAHVFPWKEWRVKEALLKCGWEMNYWRSDPESHKCILLVCLSLAKVRGYLQYRMPFKCNMIHSTYMKHTTWSVDLIHIYYLLGTLSVLEKKLPEVLTGIQLVTQSYSFFSYMD